MTQVDLDALKIERKAAKAARPRRWGLIALGAVVLFVAGTFLYPMLRPRAAVRTAPVRAVTDGARTASVGVAEAAGWIEPEPYPVTVRPLVSGVLADLLVLEGHVVKKGETVVARLESAELMAARDRAEAIVVLREAEVARAEADLRVAESLLEQKGTLRLSATEARREVARKEAQEKSAVRDLAAAEAARDAKKAELDGQERLLEGGMSYPVALARARADHRAADAAVESRRADLERVRAELAEARVLLRIAEELRDDPRGLAGEAERARAELGRKRAELGAARTEWRVAERELSWCEVKAPVDGTVMKLLSAPGESVGPDAAGIVALYDPEKLQARIDVPLASIGGVRAGQEVEIRSEAAPGTVTKGTVLRIQRESDLLKNTTQVKVRLDDPPPLLVPETLCRARILGGAKDSGENAEVPELFRVPRGALKGDAVFVFDPGDGGRARRVPVERVGDEEGGAIVRGPLSATQRVILDDVEDGVRVKEVAQ